MMDRSAKYEGQPVGLGETLAAAGITRQEIAGLLKLKEGWVAIDLSSVDVPHSSGFDDYHEYEVEYVEIFDAFWVLDRPQAITRLAQLIERLAGDYAEELEQASIYHAKNPASDKQWPIEQKLERLKLRYVQFTELAAADQS